MTRDGVSREAAVATVQAALDCGITHLDTAYCYGPQGESEQAPKQGGTEQAPKAEPKQAEEQAPKGEEPPKQGEDDGGVFNLNKLTKLLEGKIKDGLKDDLKKLAEEIEKNVKPREVRFEIPNVEPKTIKNQHFKFEEFLQTILMKEPALLSGPAGSGKSYAGNKAAEVLSRPFRYIPVCGTTTKSDIAGYVDIHGNYKDVSGLRHCVENGGIFMMDEIDAGSSNIVITINDLTAKQAGRDTWQCPNGEIIKIHENFAFVACANTWGLGADEEYVGRNRLDASTRDRFNKINWDYDEKLEAEIVDHEVTVKYIQALRKAVNKLKEKVVVSPRSAQKIAKMIKCGMVKTPAEGAERTIWPGISIDVKNRVIAALK
jgi:MoxR-like ATPase